MYDRLATRNISDKMCEILDHFIYWNILYHDSWSLITCAQLWKLSEHFSLCSFRVHRTFMLQPELFLLVSTYLGYYILHYYITTVSFCIALFFFYFLVCSIVACMTAAFSSLQKSLLAQLDFPFPQAFKCSLDFSVAESVWLEWLCTCMQKRNLRENI